MKPANKSVFGITYDNTLMWHELPRTPPESRSVSVQLRDPSAGESTLVEPQPGKVILHTSSYCELVSDLSLSQTVAREFEEQPIRHVTPFTPTRSSVVIDSSPLSSPPSSLRFPFSDVYVDVPPLPAHRDRAQYRPLSAYAYGPPSARANKDRRPSQKQQDRPLKRKRPSQATGSPSNRSPPAKRQQDGQHSASTSTSGAGEIGLDSLGDEARDVLKPFYEYGDTEIDTDLHNDIQARMPDEYMLEVLLRPIFRHLIPRSTRGAPSVHQAHRSTASMKQIAPRLPQPSAASGSGPQIALGAGSHRSLRRADEQHGMHDLPAQPMPPPFSSSSTAPSRGLEQLSAVRGHDAFFGVQEDTPEGDSLMHSSRQAAFPSTSFPSKHRNSSDRGSWQQAKLSGDASRSLPDFPPMPSGFNNDEGGLFSPDDGTINPSLLGPSGLTNQFRTPSPSPPPPSPQLPVSNVREASSSNAEDESMGIPETPDPEWEPREAEKNYKGKGRAKDVGIRARESHSRSVASLPPPMAVSGKRQRRPTAKVKETLDSVVLDRGSQLPSPKSDVLALRDPDVGAASRTKLTIKVKPIKQKAAGRNAYCHHCRGKNSYDKMKCSATHPDGDLCALFFCQKCIAKR